MMHRWRFSGVNVLLLALTAASGVVVFAFLPGVPVGGRVAAVCASVLSVLLAIEAMRRARQPALTALGPFVNVRGWAYLPEDDELAGRFGVFPMTAGVRGRVEHAVRGPHRFHDCATFIYTTNMPGPQLFQVTLVELGGALPTFELLPEDVIATAAKMAGGQDVKVGDHAFDSRWRVISDDPDFVRQTFTYDLRKRLLERDTRGMPIVVDDGAILTWRAGVEGVRRLTHRLDTLIAVAESIPESAWHSHPRK